jgi:hypothetical protein
MKNLLKGILLFILLPQICNAQKMIDGDIYLYGKLDSIIKGKILVSYKVKDPETGIIVMTRFEKNCDSVISMQDYFFPGISYRQGELDTFMKDNNIKTIILVDLIDVSSHTESFGTSFYSNFLKSRITSVSTTNVLDNLRLTFEIYNNSDNFNRPKAIIYADGKNGFGQLGKVNGTLKRTIDKIIDTLEYEGAFGTLKMNEKKRKQLEGMDEYINGK